jgi:nucleoside-diphosphate-sugar epimerase
MSSILVTGATSFIGRQCVPLLIAAGHEVHALSRSEPFDARAQWHRADLLDPAQARSVVRDIGATHLLHVAWYAVPGKFWTSTENLRWTSASIDLFEHFVAAGGTRIVGVGSCAEYEWGHGICREDSTPLRPATLYGACKGALRQVLDAFTKQAGVSSAWARVFSLYGPHEHPDRLVAAIMRSVLRGERAQRDQGALIRDYLHVKDVASALAAILLSDHAGPVNVASGVGISLRELATRAAAAAGRPDLLDVADGEAGAGAGPGEPPLLVADVARLHALGWRPEFSLDAGLADSALAWRG